MGICYKFFERSYFLLIYLFCNFSYFILKEQYLISYQVFLEQILYY
jgi:hypothetical protein